MNSASVNGGRPTADIAKGLLARHNVCAKPLKAYVIMVLSVHGIGVFSQAQQRNLINRTLPMEAIHG